MPQTKFQFGKNMEHKIEIDYRWWGKEKYIIDDVTEISKFNLSLSGVREFNVGEYKLRIEVSIKPKVYFSRALVDGKVIIEELFPEVKTLLEKWSKPPYSLIGPIFLFAISALLAMAVISIFR